MTHHSDQDRVWSLIERIGHCMFVTHDGTELRARPMSAHADREQDAIYFLTDARNHKDDEVQINDQVCLTFADNGSYVFVSISGTANVRDDRAKVHELWSVAAQAFWEPRTTRTSGCSRCARIRPSSGTAPARSSPPSRWQPRP